MTAPVVDQVGRPDVIRLHEVVNRPTPMPCNDLEKYVLLQLDTAQKLLTTIGELCAEGGEHVVCPACSTQALCETCGLGKEDDWCPHLFVCPDCAPNECGRCRLALVTDLEHPEGDHP